MKEKGMVLWWLGIKELQRKIKIFNLKLFQKFAIKSLIKLKNKKEEIKENNRKLTKAKNKRKIKREMLPKK